MNEKIENIDEKLEQLEVEKSDLEVVKNVSEEEIKPVKKIVIPGEVVSKETKKLGSNVSIVNGQIVSTVLGLLYESNGFVSVVALKGKYSPRMNDVIVGIINGENHTGYNVEINSFYDSFISKKDFRDQLKIGSIVSAKVSNVNELNEVDLINPRVFFGGEVIKISPVKIPRVIGKNGSMLNVLKKFTRCNLLVGKNGFIWLKNGNVDLAIEALRKIEREAHLPNLTNKITNFLKKNSKRSNAN